MNYEQSHRKLISGQHTGPVTGVLRLLLSMISVGYTFVVRLRNVLYSKGWLKVHHVDATVICVGNITTGGTGKTPLVVWVYSLITSYAKSQISDSRCAILTRGYKAAREPDSTAHHYSDEIAIFAESCPEARVIVNPDRVAGANEAIHKFNAEVLIMDDGFQHRRLARDIDIVTIDATQPFVYGKILPAGLLREPVTALKRADAVVITRCDQIGAIELDGLENKLRTIHPDLIIAKSIHAPVCVKYPEPPVIPAKAGIQKDNEKVDSCLRRNDNIKQLKGKKVLAFCGIGNPRAFLETIRHLGCDLIGSKVYNDHYHYTKDCLSDLFHQAQHHGAELILTTQKDWTKVSRLVPAKTSISLAYLRIEIQFLSGREQLTALIEEALQGRIAQNP